MIENFLRYFTNDAEFHRICDGLPDKRHRAFLRFAYAQLISRSSEYTPTPDGKFDLAFFAKVVLRMYEHEPILRTIMDGDLKSAGLDPDDLEALG